MNEPLEHWLQNIDIVLMERIFNILKLPHSESTNKIINILSSQISNFKYTYDFLLKIHTSSHWD